MSTTKKQKTQQNVRRSTTTTTPLQSAATASGKLKKLPGSRLPRTPFRQQAKRMYVTAKTEEAALKKVGYPREKNEALNEAAQTFEAVDKASLDAKAAAKAGSLACTAVVAAAFAFRQELMPVIRVAALANPEALLSAPLNMTKVRTPAQMVQWLNDTETTMNSLRPELAQASSVDWFAKLQSQRAALTEAIAVHQELIQSRASLANKSVDARNALVDKINTLRTYAGMAFARQPDMLKKFNKGYVAAKHSTKKVLPAASASSTATPAPASTPVASTAAAPVVTPAAAPAVAAPSPALHS